MNRLRTRTGIRVATLRRGIHTEPFPFKPPPIRTRLRPLVPFFIYWSIITSLAVHLLHVRTAIGEDLDRSQAQMSVLQGLIARYQRGEKVQESEVQRELEMVGLREREVGTREVPTINVAEDVGWRDVIFGKRRKKEEAKTAREEWDEMIQEVSEAAEKTPRAAAAAQHAPQGMARRATGANVYL